MEPEDADVEYEWAFDGVYYADSESITVPSDTETGTVITLTVTDADGNEASDSVVVTSDKSLTFELVDDNGFQEDGTARTTDTLRVSYGSELGTPRHITWYNDGAVMAVYTLDANSLTQDAFNSNLCRSKGYDAVSDTYTELAPGNWKVTIENTSGDLWESNEVTVVYEGQAVMSDVSIEDDYETPMAALAGVELTKNISRAILNVTFNKDYAGKLYLIDSKIEKSYTGHIANVLDMGTTAGTYDSIKDALTEVKTKGQLTNKNASAAATGATEGIYFEDSTGAIHCKFLVDLAGGQTVTRGSSYYLVWDQDDVTGDEITAKSTREDLNASDDVEVPYVEAPASIKVSSFATGSNTVKVDALDEDGEKLAWYTNETSGVANQGLTSAKIFKVDTNAKSSTDTSENAASTAVKEGVYTFTTAAAIPNAYVYVQLKTIAGVFAKDSITLESDLSETARDALTSMSLEEDSTTPTSAVVKFKGLSTKAPGKVYIMQGNLATESLKATDTTAGGEGAAKVAAAQATAYGLIAAHDLSDAIAEADVEGGASSVTIPNVFEAADMENPTATTLDTYGKDMGNDAFVAVFVPDDEELWKRANSLAADAADNMLGFQLKPVITTIDKSELTATLISSAALANAAGPVIKISGIQAMDQFGNKWVGTARTTDTASVSKNNSTVTNTENAAATTTTSVAGVVDIDVTLEEATSTTTATWDKGDGVTIKVPALKNLEVTISAKGVLTADANSLIKDGATTAAGKVAVDATLKAAGTTAANGTLKLSDALSIS